MGPLPELLEGASAHLLDGGRVVVVVSSLMDGHALEMCLEGWDGRTLGEQRLFFEKLAVLELRPINRRGPLEARRRHTAWR